MAKAKPFGQYLKSLPEKKLTITLQKPNAAVKDYDEGDFPLDLVAVGAVIDGQTYIDGFEMTPEVKKKLMGVLSGEAVTVTLVADDSDADNFPSVVE